MPELRPERQIKDEGIRERDWERKLGGKVYADNRRGAVTSTVKQGDQVLLRNTKSSGKLTTNFETEPYTVQQKDGQDVTLVSKDGVEYRRNTSLVKRYQTQNSMTDNAGEREEIIQEDTLPCTPVKSPQRTTVSRPTRQTILPNKYKDYVM